MASMMLHDAAHVRYGGVLSPPQAQPQLVQNFGTVSAHRRCSIHPANTTVSRTVKCSSMMDDDPNASEQQPATPAAKTRRPPAARAKAAGGRGRKQPAGKQRLQQPAVQVELDLDEAEDEEEATQAGEGEAEDDNEEDDMADLDEDEAKQIRRAGATASRYATTKAREHIPFDPMELTEDDPLYVPALTDEQLAEDPVDHRSGYVAVIGKPNAGKSSLINALVGQKLSIVSYKPQTTRHRIMGIASSKEYQMILFDTPGIIERKRNKLEERMMMAVVGSIQDSEAIIAVVDAADRPKEALAMFQPGPNWTGPPMAVLLNKCDLVDGKVREELVQWYKTNCRAEQVFLGSATQGNNVEAIKQWAVSKLPLGPTLYSKEVVSEQPQRFFVAELIRERLFFLYHEEVPYSAQVQVVDWRERPQPEKLFISAQIVVAKSSQVGIVVGNKGAAIKKLGQEARKEIEEFLQQPVYLELGVQVSEKWQENKEVLERMGYWDPMLI